MKIVSIFLWCTAMSLAAGCTIELTESNIDRTREIRVLLDEESAEICRDFEVGYDTESAIVSFCFADAFETSYNKNIRTHKNNILPECESLAAECIAAPPDEILEETDLGCDDTTTQQFEDECTATVGDVELCFASISDRFTGFVEGLDCSNVLERIAIFEEDTPECAATELKCPEFE